MNLIKGIQVIEKPKSKIHLIMFIIMNTSCYHLSHFLYLEQIAKLVGFESEANASSSTSLSRDELVFGICKHLSRIGSAEDLIDKLDDRLVWDLYYWNGGYDRNTLTLKCVACY